MPAAIGAAGAILHYLKTELRRSLGHITRLAVYQNSQFMVLDATTQANLELVQARGGGRDTSLLSALDRTVTPMGARKLRDWILHPLCALGALGARQQMIADFLAEPFLLGNIRETLKSIRDMERTVGRLTQTGGNARDLQVLRTSLEQIPQLKADLHALVAAPRPDALASLPGRVGVPPAGSGVSPERTSATSGASPVVRKAAAQDAHPTRNPPPADSLHRCWLIFTVLSERRISSRSQS